MSRLAIVTLTALFAASLFSQAFAATPPSFKGVIYDGKPFFVHGVNMPWIRWGCDFGSACNIRDTEGDIRRAFQDFRASDVNVVRWWLFPGNPVTYPDYGGNIVTLVDSAGKPVDFHPDVYADIEYVLNLASEYGVKLNFTIYSSHGDLPASWKEDPAHRQALANLLGKLAGRFANRPEVFAWELFNEPEAGLGNPEDSNPYARNVKELTRLVIAAQRQALAGSSPRALINLGPDRVKPAHFEFWKSLDVDFWSPHYYDNMTGETNALATTADEIRARHGITQPILLGELYLGRGTPAPNSFVPPSVNLDPLARYEDVLARGYAGAWGWAYRPQNDGLTVDMQAAKAFAAAHPDLIGPRGNASTPAPTSPATSTPTPISLPTQTPSPAATQPPAATSPASPTATPPLVVLPAPVGETTIFGDSLAADWSTAQSWSGTARNTAGTGVNGSAGLRFSCTAGWCGLRFTPVTGPTVGEGSKIRFHYRSDGSPASVTYKVFVNGPAGMHILGYITTSSQWQQAVFTVDTPAMTMGELVLQEHHGAGANMLVLDNVSLAARLVVGDPAPSATATSAPSAPSATATSAPSATATPAPAAPSATATPAPAAPSATATPAPAAPSGGITIFTDSLSAGWVDQSWSGQASSVAGGGPDKSAAYGFTCKSGWCGVRFVNASGVALAAGSRLTFSHQSGGQVNATYKVFVVNDSGMHVLGYVTPGAAWAQASFDLGALTRVHTVVLQEHHGSKGGVILLDNVGLSK